MDAKKINWQASISRNIFYSNFLLVGLVLVCITGGYVFDVVANSFWFKLYWKTVALELVNLERIPYATYAMSAFGLIFIIALYLFHKQLILKGLDAVPILKLADQSGKHPLNEVLISMSKEIGLSHSPTLYIANTRVLNAFVSGLREKSTIMVITQGLLTELKPLELQAVILMQLAQIKALDQRLGLVLAYVSNLHLIIFDLIYHPFIYGKNRDREPNPLFNLGFKCLKIARFLMPVPTFLMRFILKPNRILQANQVAVSYMGNNQALARAIKKINDIQFEKMDEMGEIYGEIPLDEIRREMYVFDPADISKCQTFASPFTTHPTLDEQLDAIGFQN